MAPTIASVETTKATKKTSLRESAAGCPAITLSVLALPRAPQNWK